MREPDWITMIPGVRLQLRRPDGLDDAIVDAKVSQVMARVYAGAGDLADYGFDDADRGVMAQEDVMMGLSVFVTACAYAERCIVAWEIGDGEGEQPELSPETIRELMRVGADPEGGLPMLRPFQMWLRTTQVRRSQEGKGLPPSQNGTGAGAASTAGGAGRKARPARTASRSNSRRPTA